MVTKITLQNKCPVLQETLAFRIAFLMHCYERLHLLYCEVFFFLINRTAFLEHLLHGVNHTEAVSAFTGTSTNVGHRYEQSLPSFLESGKIMPHCW